MRSWATSPMGQAIPIAGLHLIHGQRCQNDRDNCNCEMTNHHDYPQLRDCPDLQVGISHYSLQYQVGKQNLRREKFLSQYEKSHVSVP